MSTHNDKHTKLVEQAIKRPGVRQAYDELEEEFALLETLVQARQTAGKTQAEVAKEMGTTTSVIGRLESAGGKQQHSPTLSTLRRYAKALGYQLSIKLVMSKSRTQHG